MLMRNNHATWSLFRGVNDGCWWMVWMLKWHVVTAAFYRRISLVTAMHHNLSCSLNHVRIRHFWRRRVVRHWIRLHGRLLLFHYVSWWSTNRLLKLSWWTVFIQIRTLGTIHSYLSTSTWIAGLTLVKVLLLVLHLLLLEMLSSRSNVLTTPTTWIDRRYNGLIPLDIFWCWQNLHWLLLLGYRSSIRFCFWFQSVRDSSITCNGSKLVGS